MGFRYSVEVQALAGGKANYYVFDRDANQGRGRTVTSLGAFGTFDTALEMAESMEDAAGRPEREVHTVGCWDCGRTWLTGKPAPICECKSGFVAPIIDVKEVPEMEPFEIDPRGKIYWNDGTVVQWSRVINGKVFHFAWVAPSDYWCEPACVKVWSHPYGNINDRTETRYIELNNPTRQVGCRDCGYVWESFVFRGHSAPCPKRECQSRNTAEITHELAA